MTINKSNIENNAITLAVEGRLDTVTAPQLEAEFKAVLPLVDTVVLDFAALEYISSAGLRVLLAAQKGMNAKEGKLILKNANESILEVFDITGFSDILTIEK